MLSKKENLLPGNVVIYHSPEGDKYCHLDAQDIYNISTGYMDNDKVHSPVPVTPEVLLRCGFKKYKDANAGNVWKSFRYKHICIDYRTKTSRGIIVWYDNNDDYGITLPSLNIKYLHQLQNLYYFMTGTELDVSQLLNKKI